MRTESKLRSLIKSFTWRLIAITDTILVVMAVTCFHGNCSLEDALAIGAFEFGFKFVVYYVHERIWQRALIDGVLTKRSTLFKTISWRIIATAMTFAISGTILNAFDEIALYIALIELFTKFVLYYFHEQLWLKLPLGRIRRFIFKRIGK